MITVFSMMLLPKPFRVDCQVRIRSLEREHPDYVGPQRRTSTAYQPNPQTPPFLTERRKHRPACSRLCQTPLWRWLGSIRGCTSVADRILFLPGLHGHSFAAYLDREAPGWALSTFQGPQIPPRCTDNPTSCCPSHTKCKSWAVPIS